MVVFETRCGKRFVLRLGRGEEPIATLRFFCEREGIRSAWFRMTGLCEWAALAHWDAQLRSHSPPQRLDGPLVVVAGEGTISLRSGELHIEARALLSAQRGEGFATFGGWLVAASAMNLECLLESFEDIRLEREEDEATGLLLWKGDPTPGIKASPFFLAPPPTLKSTTPKTQSPSSPPPSDSKEKSSATLPSKGAPVGWADVMRVSAAVDADEALSAKDGATSTKSEAKGSKSTGPQKGDRIDHRKFGLCYVEDRGPDGSLRIRLPSMARKSIVLDVFEVLPPRYEGERRIFPLRPKQGSKP
ncbi:MAG: DUF296 domain-containing protein [Sandaracinaceae bacterium]|nr:DUF296 domain-containing protein [Sandaracinaceae bacterium]